MPSPFEISGSSPDEIFLFKAPLSSRAAWTRFARIATAGVISTHLLAAMAQTTAPPVAPEAIEHHVGKVIFQELVTPDIALSERFYGGVFGWTFHETTIGNSRFAEALLDGRRVGGIIQTRVAQGEQRQPSWLTFFATEDVDGAQTSALQNGAKVLLKPRTIAGRGREAIFADPQGAVFGVLAAEGGDPPDVLADPGEWIWSSLIVTDADKDAAFYQELFGYEVFDVQKNGGMETYILASDNYSRASANTLPTMKEGGHPHWLNFVRVSSVRDSVGKAVALGGKVLVEPRLDRHGGELAVVADPTGAPFGMMEWTTLADKVGAR